MEWTVRILLSCLAVWWTSSHSAKGQFINRYVYTSLSCANLIPVHSSQLTTTTTSTTKAPPPKPLDPNAITTITTTTPPPTALPTTTPSPAGMSLSTPVTVTLLNHFYAPGRLHTVMVSSLVPFEGFLLQIRKNATLIVGSFVDPPPLTTNVNCPGGDSNTNTAVDTDAPVLLSNLIFTWRAPNANMGTLTLRLSVVSGKEYKIVEKSLMPSSLPPLNSNGCGTDRACFRVCPVDVSMCPFTDASYVAILKNDTSYATITLGLKIKLLRNYVAIGFTKDRSKLTDMDLNICYVEKANITDIQYAHLYLPNKDANPLPHQGVVELEKSYVDGNMLWCQFRRPLKGLTASTLHLDDSLYMFFFTGHQHGQDFDIPPTWNMMRLKHTNFMTPNTFIYLESGGRKESVPISLVTLLIIVFFSFHFHVLFN